VLPVAVTFAEARLALHSAEFADAEAPVSRAFADGMPGDPYAAYARAATAGLPDAAERLSAVTLDAEENEWAAASLARAAYRLHADPATRLVAAREGTVRDVTHTFNEKGGAWPRWTLGAAPADR
jgi:hypothetical protein